MPSASEDLRAEFGISEEKAEQVILQHGGKINKGWITVPENCKLPSVFYRACEFLIDEWDYAMESWRDESKS